MMLKVYCTYFFFGDTSKRHQILVGTFYLEFLALVGIKFYKSDRCSLQKSKKREKKKVNSDEAFKISKNKQNVSALNIPFNQNTNYEIEIINYQKQKFDVLQI